MKKYTRAVVFLIKNSIKKKNRGMNIFWVLILAGMLIPFFSQSANAASMKVCVKGKTFNNGWTEERLAGVGVYYAEGVGGGLRGYTGDDGCYEEAGLPAGLYVDYLQVKDSAGTRTITYNSIPIRYVFKDSEKIKDFYLTDGLIDPMWFTLDAYNGSVDFKTTRCDDASIVPSADILYAGKIQGTTNASGDLTLPVYPGLYSGVFAQKFGLVNSDSTNIPISSNEVFRGQEAKFCLKPNFGSASGRVTVCETNNPIPGASLYSNGEPQTAWGTTDGDGYYSFNDIATGIYENVQFGGLTDFINSASKTVEIIANGNTITDFCLYPKSGTRTYSWTPVEGENFYMFLRYKLYVTNNTVNPINNATVTFLLDGNERGSKTFTVASNSSAEIEFETSNFTLGSHSAGIRVVYNGETVLNEERTINMIAGGRLIGIVKDAQTDTGVMANIKINNKDYRTYNNGTFDIGLATGDYTGVYSYKDGYDNSILKSFTIENKAYTTQDFYMNKKTGSISVSIRRNGEILNVPDVSVYWGDNDPKDPPYLVGTTNVFGTLVGMGLPAGTYTNVYAEYGGYRSDSQTVTISANATTQVTFNFTSTTPYPILNLSADSEAVYVDNPFTINYWVSGANSCTAISDPLHEPYWDGLMLYTYGSQPISVIPNTTGLKKYILRCCNIFGNCVERFDEVTVNPASATDIYICEDPPCTPANCGNTIPEMCVKNGTSTVPDDATTCGGICGTITCPACPITPPTGNWQEVTP
ncbi:MAG: hypothetical protein A2489_03410 [Candidatus Moranbacteria bacterium RIFOXYC12_FULL_36_13]|nr:MAG: hypothetical protein UR78_C0030G0005 [Candidatus Moranbacteria bacterium GW2011_GWF2_35_39]OGI32244.1 MAG: hypothetical protein A2343_01575 [Candidatus Moranbacteria bacterium RIFOXYB12_FULL_35_8]OGI33144.1 MAG: hypothetical protein A2489_03410 [Candidatus Moranbacteria bacterium RIFOXYC12_FULL_36_13]